MEPVKITDKRLQEIVTDWRNRKPRSLRDNGSQGPDIKAEEVDFPRIFLILLFSRHAMLLVVFITSGLYSTIGR